MSKARTPKPGRAISNYRINNHMSQADLGRKVGVTRATVCRWEKDKRKVDDEYVEPLAEETGIAIEVLRPDLARFLRRKEPA